MSEAAVCAGARPQASRVFAWLPRAPHLAASRSPLCPSAVESSPHTPAGSDRSSLWFSLPLAGCSESPGSCVCSAPSTARPGTLLGRRLTCVTSVNSLRPPCCCLGPPALLSTCVLSLRLPGAGRGGAGRVVPALLCL
uniref:Uncharacterized protein n=1 Tax=Myotis myotis TaxID=51298 RepID=A0A7J7TTV4_MYOMY|nr:hypothetical protein mMyoMyo1_009005 [Myotis myotis]